MDGKAGRSISVFLIAIAFSCGAWHPLRMTAAPTGVRSPRPPQKERVNPDAQALAVFQARVRDYLALHKKIEDSLTKLSSEASSGEIDAHNRALGRMLQQARNNARPGDIFHKDSRAVIRRVLNSVFSGPDGKARLASVMDENPGPIKIEVNSRYPDDAPLSTVPPQVLEALPRLPPDLEFRFTGRRMILLDADAFLVVDYIENALPR